MAENAFTEYLNTLDEADREWFEERIAIIQYSGEHQIEEIEAARAAYRCFQKYKNQKGRKEA